MFTQLKELSEKAKINVFIKSLGDKMEVVVFFEIEHKKDETFNVAPLVLEGTPEELEKDFVQTIELFTKQNMSSLERISLVTKQIAKAAEESTSKATSKSKGSKTKETTKKEEASLFDTPAETKSEPKKEESKVTPEETVSTIANLNEKEKPEQIDLESSIKEVEAESNSESKTEADLKPAEEEHVASKQDIPQYSEKVKERIADLEKLGFVLKPEENQYVRGGLGLGVDYIVNTPDIEFDRGYESIKQNIEENKKKFSSGAEEITFEEPKKAPVTPPIAPAKPKVETLQDMWDNMIKQFEDAGYATNQFKREDATEKYINDCLEWLKANPLQH